ncbi:Regulatory protein, LuxR:Response regulator receiver [Polaromonas sp. CG9_12]|uniref:response regulator n=1 Tax=Polaromonas sp. CG_9.11 TaxID=2787730 RepID=UPI0004DDDB3D|nr:response regulator [Polaromonas sp. CG_9.11]MBG6078292.1 DNA-binding NarL/FixJ family response regulator [Polaromonas sp. CG_9.11]CDS53811.1 Regulatory protein, LuxR:Response regulator receiver [Polaromonas sp. CG9_12]
MAPTINERHTGVMDQENASLRIFIADDSLFIRDRVALMLGASAMTVVGQAETPQDSIEGILAVYPDVVVLDVQLEGGSGLQVLRAIRHAAPDIAFVIFSNSSDPIYRKCYLGAGAEDFLDKTHQFDQLAKAVLNASQQANS